MEGQRKKGPKLKAARAIDAQQHDAPQRTSSNESPPMPIATASEAGADRPTEEAIRIRAYERYVGRDPSHGDALEDWLAAERDARIAMSVPEPNSELEHRGRRRPDR